MSVPKTAVDQPIKRKPTSPSSAPTSFQDAQGVDEGHGDDEQAGGQQLRSQMHINLPSCRAAAGAGEWVGALVHVSLVKRFTLTGSFLPFVRRDGIWTGFFFFHWAQVMGPSGVSMISSSSDMGTLRSKAKEAAAFLPEPARSGKAALRGAASSRRGAQKKPEPRRDRPPRL